MLDLGTPADSRFTIVPPGLLADRYPARVIKIDGSRAFDGTTTDPGHCRLLPEPGSSDPTIELRGDIGAVLILLDVDGRLIVLRVADGGYDARTGAEAASRGYGRDDAVLAVMLQIISEIRFAATSATIDRSGPTVEIPAGLTPTMTPATVEQMVLAAIARDEQRFHEALVPARVTAIRLMPPGSTVAGGAPGSGAGPFDRLTWAVTADGTFLSCGSHCSAYTSATTFIPDDGSSGSGPLGNGTGFAVPDPGFIAALSAQGQAFRPASAPTTGVISAGSVIGDLSQVHPKADFYGPIFGLVTCEDQMKLGPQGVGCAALGADKADQTTAIWWFDVGFRWVAIDATTGSTLARGGP